MATIDKIKILLDEVKAEDVAEDAAFQAQIDALSTSNAAVIAERDALLAEKTATIADLLTVRDQLTAAIAALDTRITALGG